MAFALTKFKARGIRLEGATRAHCYQEAVFNITALAADVTYDIGTLAGTFWTSAIADTAYGSLATAARTKLLTNIAGAIATGGLVEVQAEALGSSYVRVVGAPAGATEYRVQVASSMPTVSFFAASGPTSLVLVLRWILDDGIEPVVADLGAAIS